LYLPSDDTLLLIDSLNGYSGFSALEIGVGAGDVCTKLKTNFDFVVGVDIDIEAIRYCKNNIESQITWICCEVVSCITGKFDLIVSNPPYLPSEKTCDIKDITIYGGKNGVEMTIKFIQDSLSLLKHDGKIILVVSSIGAINKLNKFIRDNKLEKKIINEKKLFFEFLYVYEILKKCD
jgi:release factor glutamine methyltransferase